MIQADNIRAALKHVDRVFHVRLTLSEPLAAKIFPAMQEPFLVLTCLFLTASWYSGIRAPPDNFLGGSAPRLQAIGLCDIPYPALPTLLLSTSELIKLDLKKILLAGYISPEAIVASLAALPKLEIFVMEFDWDTHSPHRTRTPPVTRTILPALAYFVFRGHSEYLEDLVGRIDGPRLNHISITTLYRHVGFQVAQLSRFVDQSVGLKLAQCRHAEVLFHRPFSYCAVTFNFCHRPDDLGQDRTTIISYEKIDRDTFRETAQMLHQIPVTLSNVVHLQIKWSFDFSTYIPEGQAEGMSIQLFQLIRQFFAMQTLLIDSKLSGFVTSILGYIPEPMMTEALPSLELLCLEEYCQQSLQLDTFVAARRHSDHPVTIVNTKKEFREILDSYISKDE